MKVQSGSGLQSFAEISAPLLDWLRGLHARFPSADILIPIGSRGTIPLAWFVKAACEAGEFPGWEVRFRYTIFSIENLSEMLLGGQIREPGWTQACRQPASDLRAPLYATIAESLQEDLAGASSVRGDRPVLIIDADEVNTLSNLRERAKIYSSLRIPDTAMLHVLSVIGTGRRNVKVENEQEFRQIRPSWSESIDYDEIIVPSPISWSDDEVFFDRIGIRYPPMAVPHPSFVTGLVRQSFVDDQGVRRSGYGLFYLEFYRQFGVFLGENPGVDLWLRWFEASRSQIERIFGPATILSASHRALLGAVDACAGRGALKREFAPPPLDHDVENGQVLNSHNGKPLLRIHSVSMLGQELSYRYPFALISERGSQYRDQCYGFIEQQLQAVR